MLSLHKLKLMLPLMVACFILSGTSAQNQSNNYGKEFRFTFLENNGLLEKVSFNVSSEKKPFILRISCSFYKDTFIVYRKDTVLSYTRTGSPSSSIFLPGRSILMSATENISLTAMNNSLNSTDISSILPSEKIPGNPVYYINTYRGDESIGKSNNSLFSVVAIDDSCMINILPSCDSKNNLVKNTLYSVLLRKGQVYIEQAADSQSFAGTKIWNSKGCKRFNVFEGAKCSYVEYNNSSCKGCDHLFNQTRPTQYLGKSFTTVPYTDNSGGYIYQIVATENNTQISLNGNPTTVLSEGQAYLVNQKSNVSVCIKADKKISVVELMKSGDCNGHSNLLGNPSLMTLVPDDQLSTQAAFSYPTTKSISLNPSFPAEFYLAVISKTGTLGKIRLNGTQVDTSKFNATCDMAIASFKMNGSMAYHISSPSGVIAYMYAYGLDESYASEVGFSIENRSTELSILSNKTNVCDSGYQFTFDAKSDSAANFRWAFGDGTSANGNSVNKSYNRTGTFLLKLKVDYTNNKGCTSDSAERTIKIFTRPYFTLGKDTNICNGVFYDIAPVTPPKVSFKWQNGSAGSLLSISKSSLVWLTLTDSNLCAYTDTLDVRFINCDTSNIVIPNVFTPGSSNSEYAKADNINDLFESEFSGYDELKGSIFSRWGTVVYDFAYPSQPYWNGGVQNDLSQPCPSGTYYYVYKYKNSKTGLEKTVNGVVQVIR